VTFIKTHQKLGTSIGTCMPMQPKTKQLTYCFMFYRPLLKQNLYVLRTSIRSYYGVGG